MKIKPIEHITAMWKEYIPKDIFPSQSITLEEKKLEILLIVAIEKIQKVNIKILNKLLFTATAKIGIRSTIQLIILYFLNKFIKCSPYQPEIIPKRQAVITKSNL